MTDDEILIRFNDEEPHATPCPPADADLQLLVNALDALRLHHEDEYSGTRARATAT